MKVFITRSIPNIAYQLLKQANISFEVWEHEQAIPTPLLIEKCKAVNALLCVGNFKLDSETLNELKHLKVISLHSVGYDYIDVKHANSLGIKVGNTPDVLNAATADTAFLLLLACSRKALYHHKRMLNGTWKNFNTTFGLGVELKGKTLGVFGLGNIGTVLAQRCKGAYQMPIIYHNRNRNLEAENLLDAKYVSFEALLAQSDVVVAQANLTEQTKGKFNKDAFEKMKNTAIFINTGRGGLHVESDLIEALETGQIWGAGLDVFEQEPTSPDNPLLHMESVATLPHIGSATLEARTGMTKLATQNIIEALNNRPMPSEVKG